MSKYSEYITLHANHYSCSSGEAVRYESIREACTEYRFMQGPYLNDTGTYFDYYKFGKMIEQECANREANRERTYGEMMDQVVDEMRKKKEMEKKGAFGAWRGVE